MCKRAQDRQTAETSPAKADAFRRPGRQTGSRVETSPAQSEALGMDAAAAAAVAKTAVQVGVGEARRPRPLYAEPQKEYCSSVVLLASAAVRIYQYRVYYNYKYREDDCRDHES